MEREKRKNVKIRMISSHSHTVMQNHRKFGKIQTLRNFKFSKNSNSERFWSRKFQFLGLNFSTKFSNWHHCAYKYQSIHIKMNDGQ